MKKMILRGLVLISPVWVVVACTMNSTTTGPISSSPTATPVFSSPTVTSSSPTATPTPATLTFLYNTYISASIGSSASCVSCHGSAGAQGSPMNTSSKSAFYTSVVGVASAFGCGSQLVTANDTSQSALYNRLSGSSCSPQMPNGGPSYLNAAQLAQFASWINAGALNN
jgi:hypothetical protein